MLLKSKYEHFRDIYEFIREHKFNFWINVVTRKEHNYLVDSYQNEKLLFRVCNEFYFWKSKLLKVFYNVIEKKTNFFKVNNNSNNKNNKRLTFWEWSTCDPKSINHVNERYGIIYLYTRWPSCPLVRSN